MKRRTKRIIGGGLVAVGLITAPFNIAAGAAITAAGGFMIGYAGPKDLPPDFFKKPKGKDKPLPPS